MLFEVKDRVLLFIVVCSSLITVCNAMQIPSGSYGGYCVNECQRRRGKNFFYCKTTKHKWDYCSPVVGLGSYGTACKENEQCRPGGIFRRYNWCYTTDGSWDYCSAQYKASPKINLTRYGYYCNDACTQYKSSYYFCNIASSWDYCSPEPYKTRYGRQCNPDHYCAKHGKNYYWCYTGRSWDYCSPIDNCAYWPFFLVNSHQSRHLTYFRLRKIICPINTTPRLRTTFSYYWEDRHRLAEPRTRELYREATGIIALWKYTGFASSETARRLYTSKTNKNVRIDLQGMFWRDEKRYANIQIQIGIHSVAGIAVLTGRDFPIRYIRRALNMSLDHKKIIFLDLERRY